MLIENLKKKTKSRTDTAVLKKADTENRTDLEKIPSKIPKTDTELKNRHRPTSTVYINMSHILERPRNAQLGYRSSECHVDKIVKYYSPDGATKVTVAIFDNIDHSPIFVGPSG
jgi:hypothetical protein